MVFKGLASRQLAFVFITFVLLFFQNCGQAFKSGSTPDASTNQQEEASQLSPPLPQPPASTIPSACGETPHLGTETRVFYLASSGQTCDGIERTRTCNSGEFSAWSGSDDYNSESCTVDGQTEMSCGPTPHLGFETETFYPEASVTYGDSCGAGVVQRRQCSNGAFGSWDGPLTEMGCTVEPPPANACLERSPLQNELKDLGTAIDNEQVRTNFPLAAGDFLGCPEIQVPNDSYAPPARGTSARNTYIEPWYDYTYTVLDFSDQYLRLPDGEAKSQSANCVLDHLYALAQTGVFTEPRDSYVDNQGEYDRNWFMGSYNLSLSKILGDANLDQAKRQVVLAWIDDTADIIQDKFTRHISTRPENRNTTFYWAGLTMMTSGLNLNQQSRFDLGVQWIQIGLDQIQDNGTLPLELLLEGDAFLYHGFAIQTLVYAAEVARLNNVDLYSYNNSALDRLIALMVTSLDDDSHFETVTGIPQNMTGTEYVAGHYSGWIVQVFARNGDVRLIPHIRNMLSSRLWRLSDTRITHGLPCLEAD